MRIGPAEYGQIFKYKSRQCLATDDLISDYGQFIHKKLDDVNPEEQDISFVVPETGEYGIGVQHINYEVNLAASEFFMPENKEQPSDANIIAASAPQSVDSDTVSIELKINKVFKNPLIK